MSGVRKGATTVRDPKATSTSDGFDPPKVDSGTKGEAAKKPMASHPLDVALAVRRRKEETGRNIREERIRKERWR